MSLYNDIWEDEDYEHFGALGDRFERELNSTEEDNSQLLKKFVIKYGFIPAGLDFITPELEKELEPYITYNIEGVIERPHLDTADYDGGTAEELMCDYIICCSKNNEKFELVLAEILTTCGSGYTCATEADMALRKVKEFGEMTYVPKEKPMMFKLKNDFYGGYECDAFRMDDDGGDPYYPMGSVEINEELFMEIDRTHNEESIVSEDIPDNLNFEDISSLEDEIKSLTAKRDELREKNAMFTRWVELIKTKRELIEEIRTLEEERDRNIASFADKTTPTK